MKTEELKKIKEAFSYLFEYNKIGFYCALFLGSYIFIFFLQIVLGNIINSISNHFFTPSKDLIYVFTIVLSFIITFCVYYYEEKTLKQLSLVKKEIIKKYNKQNINKKLFSKILLDLIKELENKNIINLSEKHSNLSRKEFKQMLKNKIKKEKTLKELKKEILT